MSKDLLVVSTSLNPGSHSFKLAQAAFEIAEKKTKTGFVDLRQYKLPLCDGEASFEHRQVNELKERIQCAGCVLMALPVYNYSAGSSAKNLVELTGQAWQEKIVGFLCAAGGSSSYMSVMGIANSLMLDFRCLIIPKFVYADGSAFPSKGIDSKIYSRVEELVETAVRLNKALDACLKIEETSLG